VAESPLAARLRDIAGQFDLTVEQQRDILLIFIQDHAGAQFDKFMGYYVEAMLEARSTAPAAQKVPEAAHTPYTGQCAELEGFFDRSLAKASLQRLVQLPSDGKIHEQAGYDTARLVLPIDEWTAVKGLLDDPTRRGRNDTIPENGQILCGWYHIFADGAIGAIAMTWNSPENGGPYLDPFVIIPDGVHPTVPNPTLQPCRTLDEDFMFRYPDSTFKVLRLVPPSPQRR